MTEAAFPFLPPSLRPDTPALLEDGRDQWLSHGALRHEAGQWRDRLGIGPGLVFVMADNGIATVAALLGVLAAGKVAALLPARLPEAAMARLVAAYGPDVILRPPGLERGPGGGPAPHPDLAVLLSTSGSTGSPKMVRLCRASLEDNARAIGTVLGLTRDDVAAGHLPLDYSYGLSVLTSHLARGARVALTRMGFMDRAFWPRLKAVGATTLAGVPFHFQMLERLRFERLDLPALRILTQAGGRMELGLQRRAHDFMAVRGGRFFVMYGQTEAAPRMTTLPHQDFPAKAGSVGPALPGGRITIMDGDGRPLPPGAEGEVIYAGANVMMGYAENRADLARPDQLDGVLRTGDLGRLDSDGYLTLTGRRARFAKVYGWRISLDEVETLAEAVAGQPAAAVEHGDSIRLVCQGPRPGPALVEALVARFALSPHLWRVEAMDSLPRTPGGKIDYARLAGRS